MAELSFSDRMAAIMRINSEYKNAHPDEELSKISTKAKSLEQEIYAESKSQLEYEEKCNSLLEGLQRQAKLSVTDLIETPISGALREGVATHSFGRYKNAIHFNDGLFSDLYKATIPEDRASRFGLPSGSLVALKVTYLAAMKPPHDSEREVRVLKRAESDHVIPLLESFREGGGHLVLVFPYMPIDLDQMLRRKTLTRAQERACLRDLFAALSHVHKLGAIHRDVKPSNIVLKSPSGPAYLTDFGIAWDPKDRSSEPADQKITDIGTTSYRPPEVLFGCTCYTSAVDLWAAGCVVGEVISRDKVPLFDSGDLGSDLTLIHSIFKALGTPNEAVWPETSSLPDWGKVSFRDYAPKKWEELLPHSSESAQQLVSELVKYQSTDRLKASEALRHPFFEQQ